MKKLLCILLAASFGLTITGCGSNEQPSSAAQNSSSSHEVIISSTAESPSSQKTDTVEPSSSRTTPASSSPERKTVSVIIPPGFTVQKIAARMEANDVCSADDFIRAVNEGDFSEFPLVRQIDNLDKRCYRLEGYLFPDTYEFYTDSSAESVIRKILQNTEAKINGKYSYSGLSTDQIITLASLIQAESGDGEERYNISSVLHNRLKENMPLQLDAPVIYLESLAPADTQKYKIWYNTRNPEGYECPGLPVGAICSPSAKCLDAAVNPVESNWLFFHSDSQGVYHFQTEEEWKAAQANATE